MTSKNPNFLSADTPPSFFLPSELRPWLRTLSLTILALGLAVQSGFAAEDAELIGSDVIQAFDRAAMTVVGSRPDAGNLEVFKVCDTLDFGVVDNCVQVRALDGPDGNVVASSEAKVIEFAFFARHFSSYGPAMIMPVEFPNGGLQAAADRVGSTLRVAVTNESGGAATHTLSWTSFPVEMTSDGQHIHPGSTIETSSDLQIWTETGSPQGLRLLESAQDPRTVTFSDIEGARAFYRIVLTTK